MGESARVSTRAQVPSPRRLAVLAALIQASPRRSAPRACPSECLASPRAAAQSHCFASQFIPADLELSPPCHSMPARSYATTRSQDPHPHIAAVSHALRALLQWPRQLRPFLNSAFSAAKPCTQPGFSVPRRLLQRLSTRNAASCSLGSVPSPSRDLRQVICRTWRHR